MSPARLAVRVDGVDVSPAAHESRPPPRLAALRQLMQVETDPGLAPDQAQVTVKLTAGPELAVFSEHAAGSPEHPLTDGQLAAKFAGLVAGRLPESTAQEVHEEVDRLETLADVTTLLRLCRRVA